jgi:hypothetical protein
MNRNLGRVSSTRAPRNYTLWFNGKKLPKRSYRFRQSAIRASLMFLFEAGIPGSTIEIITKRGCLTWSAIRRAGNIIQYHGV